MQKYFKVLFLNTIIFIIGLIIIETIWGGWFFDNNPIGILKSVAFRIDTSGLYTSKNPIIVYTRDQYGLRGNYSSTSQIDILTMGGSTTDQRYLDDSDTWQQKLSNRFLQDGKNISVINAGIDGQSTRGNLKDFDFWFPKIPNLKSRFVLLYEGINDLFSDDLSNYDDINGRQTIKGLIKSRSLLYSLFIKFRGLYQATFKFPLSHRKIDIDKKTWTNEPRLENPSAFIAPKIKAYRERLLKLAHQIAAMGARPIFVTQTTSLYRHQKTSIEGVADTILLQGIPVNGLDIGLMMKEINKATLEICRETDGICLDLEKDLIFSKEDFYDYFHNTPQGAQKIASYLYSHLKKML